MEVTRAENVSFPLIEVFRRESSNFVTSGNLEEYITDVGARINAVNTYGRIPFSRRVLETEEKIEIMFGFGNPVRREEQLRHH